MATGFGGVELGKTGSSSAKSSGAKSTTTGFGGRQVSAKDVPADSKGGPSLAGQGLSVVGRALSLLDVPRRGVLAVVKELNDLTPGLPGIAKDGKGANDGFSLGDIGKNYKANIGAGDLIHTGNKWADRAVGLLGDVAFDPLTYATLGVGTAAELTGKSAAKLGTKGLAKLSAEEALKVAAEEATHIGGKKTAVALAREAAANGETELANKILTRGIRGSANVLTKDEAARYGIRQGATFGIGHARVAVPGGDAVARVASKVLSPVTDQLSKLPLHGIGNAVKHLTPLERQLARDADRSRRLLADGADQQAKRALSKLVADNPELKNVDNASGLRNALEGLGAHPAAEEARKILDQYHSWAEEQLGRDLPYFDDYLSHRLTKEARLARKAEGLPAPIRPGGKPGLLRERGYKAGDVFYGETLQEGSITEMNKIYASKVGAKHALYEDNPVRLIHQYIDDVTSMVKRSPDSFATAAGAIDAPLKEVAAKGAKAAGKEARGIEKELAAAAAELDKTRGAIAAGKGKVAGLEAEHAANQGKLLDALGKGSTFDGPRIPNPTIETGAKRYIEANGLRPAGAVDRGLRVDGEFATRLANAYDALPPVGGPEATASYDALKTEVEKQYEYLTKEMGVKVEFVDGFPYDDAAKMMADVRQNKRLLVNRTTLDQTHPFFTPDQNDKFRAVHDFFGHAQAGNRFDRHGEEVAYQLHAQMFSDQAVPAMTTETRGQNAYLNYHPDNIARRAAGEVAQFPPQKAALLPPEFIGAHAAQAAAPVVEAGRSALPEVVVHGPLAELPDLASRLQALGVAAGADARTATDELLNLTGAKPTGQMMQGDRAFLMPDGNTVPERNILSHADANVRLAQRVTDVNVARAAVSAELKPLVVEQAGKFDHVLAATDSEAVKVGAAKNRQSLDALRVIGHKAKMEELALREHADFLYSEADRLRQAGDHEMANIAGLEAHARAVEASMPGIDARFEKAMSAANRTKLIPNVDAMTRQGLMQLADGRYAEPWVAEAAQAISKAMEPAQVGRLIREFDRISGFWRASALLSPGFHMRNAFGGLFNNSLADMDWSRYAQFRQVRAAFEKGGLEAIEDPMVRRAVEAAQRLGQWKGADISDVSKLAGMDKGGRIVGRQNPLFRANFSVGESVEQNLRMPLFIDAYVKSGGNEQHALDMVMKYHFDYADLSRMEREVGRRAFGFYTWARNNLPLMMSEMADHPGAFTRYTHLKRNMELGVTEDDGKPGYFNKAMAIALPFKFKGGRIYAFPELPFLSADNMLGVNELASSLNPLIKLPLETFTNTKFFEQRQMSPALKAAPATWKPILELLVHNPGIPGLPRVHRAKDGTLMMDEKEANKIESLFPMLARMRRLKPSEKKYQDRVLTSWLSFAGGVSMRVLDDATRGGEMQRRKTAAAAQTRIDATLAGGQKLNDYKAAQRQAAAIKAAQSGTQRAR